MNKNYTIEYFVRNVNLDNLGHIILYLSFRRKTYYKFLLYLLTKESIQYNVPMSMYVCKKKNIAGIYKKKEKKLDRPIPVLLMDLNVLSLIVISFKKK